MVISEEDAFRMILDLFAAGTETTSTTLQWFFIYMMYNQEVQERCRKEIQEVGNSRIWSCIYLFPINICRKIGMVQISASSIKDENN